jgi:hypothetical protein
MFTAARHESSRLLKNSDYHPVLKGRGFEPRRKRRKNQQRCLAAEVAFGHRNEFFSSLRVNSLAVERKLYVTPPS